MFFVFTTIILLLVLIYLSSKKEAMPVIHGDSTTQGTDKALSGNRIKVGTYNIQSGKGLDGKRSISRAADVLAKLELDFIGLNEIRNRLIQKNDQAQQLGELLKLGWIYCPTRKKVWYPHFGSAFLCRWKINSYKAEPLIFRNNYKSGPIISRAHRNLITIKMPHGSQEVTILVTHLDRGAIRTEQLEDVLKTFAEYSPAILMGDFNTTRDEAILQKFLADGLGQDAIREILKAEDPNSRIDWILTRGYNILSGDVHPAGVSDHPHYWVELELNERESA